MLTSSTWRAPRISPFDGSPLTIKITWVVFREDGEWKIVSHHVSSQVPLIDQV